VTYVPVGRDGLVDVEAVRAALTDKTILISIMFANNEIGTIQPVAEIGKLAKEKGIIFHTDATQAVGKIPVDVEAMASNLLSATAHMLLLGPRESARSTCGGRTRGVRIAPMVDGGGHEAGHALRYGTGAAGGGFREGGGDLPRGDGRGEQAGSPRFATAPGADRVQGGRAYVNGHPERRLPHNLNISFAYVEGESVLMGLKQGSRAGLGLGLHLGHLEPSYVISALGVDSELAHSSIRFGLHRFSTRKSGLRGPQDGRGHPAAAGDVAALRAREGRR